MTNFRSILVMTALAACIAAPFLGGRVLVGSLIEPDTTHAILLLRPMTTAAR